MITVPRAVWSFLDFTNWFHMLSVKLLVCPALSLVWLVVSVYDLRPWGFVGSLLLRPASPGNTPEVSSQKLESVEVPVVALCEQQPCASSQSFRIEFCRWSSHAIVLGICSCTAAANSSSHCYFLGFVFVFSLIVPSLGNEQLNQS